MEVLQNSHKFRADFLISTISSGVIANTSKVAALTTIPLPEDFKHLCSPIVGID